MDQVKKLFEIGALMFAFLVFAFIMIGVGTYFYFAPILDNKEAIINNNSTGLTLLDDAGKPFFEFYQAQNKDYVALSKISPYVKDAVIAVEDREFYHHNGFSLRGIGRALVLDVENHEFAFGGSTLTQQLVKNTLLTPEKSIGRKFKEIILAEELERRFSKNEILEMYLNSVYFGQGAFGIEEAAKQYFNKDAKDLNLAESSYLISMLPSPSARSEDNNPQKIKAREEMVLTQMQEQGYISATDVDKTLASALVLHQGQPDLNVIAPHFALMVRDQLIKKYGEETVVRSGLKVRTTLNSSWQRDVEESVAKNIKNLAGNNVSNGAVIVMIPSTGEIKALVGSANWYNDRFGKVNMVTTPRQPGSSFKPIVYATAFENNLITPATVLKDTPTTFKIADCVSDCSYKPKDYDGRYRGNVLVRRALANSLNIPAVEVMQKVGVDRTLDKAQSLGISSLGTDSSKYGLSLVLGAGEVPLIEMAQAYDSFANQGNLVEAKLYTGVVDKTNKTIYNSDSQSRNVWSKEVAFLISSILSDNHARAEEFGNALTVSRPAAVKTGTTENYRDAWTIGYTPDLLVGVWVGNNDNSPMDRVAGSLGAAPIWRELIQDFSSGFAVKNFDPPGDIIRLAICSNGGRVRQATSSAVMEYFLPGTEPVKSCGSLPSDNIAASSSGGFEFGVGGAPPTESPDTPTPTPSDAAIDNGQVQATDIIHKKHSRGN